MLSPARPFVIRLDHTKTIEDRVTKFSPYVSPIPLVFARYVSSKNPDGFLPSGSVK